MTHSQPHFRALFCARTALALLALTASAIRARAAAVIYEFAGAHDVARTAGGFNYAYIGDDVTAVAPDGGSFRLETLTMRFGLLAFNDFRYEQEGISNFTPSIELLVFPIDSATRLPTAFPIATGFASTQTFAPARVDDDSTITPQFFQNPNLQNVTFDFAGQEVILPEDFGFAYHVSGGIAEDGTITDEMNFFAAVASTSDETAATIGGTIHGALVSYPNGAPFDPTRFAFDGEPAQYESPDGKLGVDINVIAAITATFIPIPEPNAVLLLGLGAASLLSGARRTDPTNVNGR